jgi:hypothetical protein
MNPRLGINCGLLTKVVSLKGYRVVLENLKAFKELTTFAPVLTNKDGSLVSISNMINLEWIMMLPSVRTHCA